MVHHSLDYTGTWHWKETVCFNSSGFWPVTPQIFVWLPKTMVESKNFMNKFDAWLFYLGLSIPGMGAVTSQIFLQCVHLGPFYVYSIVPRPTTPPIWQMFQALLVYFDHIHIWKVHGCSNRGSVPFCCCCGSLYLNGTFRYMEIWHVGQNTMFLFWRQK